MFRALTASSPRELTKWGLYALVLLTPGSFMVVPVLWALHRWGRGLRRMGRSGRQF